jgi:histone H3/H4
MAPTAPNAPTTTQTAPTPQPGPAPRRRPGQRKKALVIPRAAFSRLVRELGQDFKSDLLWKANSIQALQEASEDLIQGRFHHAARLAKLCKVDTVTPQHFNELAKGARGAPTLEG